MNECDSKTQTSSSGRRLRFPVRWQVRPVSPCIRSPWRNLLAGRGALTLALPGLLALLSVVGQTPARAQCDQDPVANDDNAETADTPIVIDVLANDSDPLGLALTLSVRSNNCPSTTVEVVADSLRLIPLSDLLQDCQVRYRATNEENLWAEAIVQVRQRTRIFSDGFEGGDADAWTDCDPSCP